MHALVGFWSGLLRRFRKEWSLREVRLGIIEAALLQTRVLVSAIALLYGAGNMLDHVDGRLATGLYANGFKATEASVTAVRSGYRKG